MLEQIVFYVFSLLAVGSASMVVLSKSPIRSALSLVVTFIACAGLWILLQAEFLGLVLVLVYVGAVMTLFLFVIMMIDMNLQELRSGFVRYLPFAVIITLLMLVVIVMALSHVHTAFPDLTMPYHDARYSNIDALGEVLYTEYAYPFVLAGALLLAAIIAAISLTFRGPRQSKKQRVDRQVSVNPKERVYLTNLAPKSQSTGDQKS